MSSSTSKLQALTANIERIIRGKPQEVRFVITALIARGHILLEDNPGAGKTVLAKTLAQSVAEPKEADGSVLDFAIDPVSK